MLRAPDIRRLYNNRTQEYPELPAIRGENPGRRFPGFHEYDPMIQFWTEYWKDRDVLPQEVDPLLIKTIIAEESSFRPDPSPDPGKALGLMQLLSDTLDYLGRGENGVEVRRYQMDLEDADVLNPVVNIAAGTRWLGHKIEESRRLLRDPQDVNERIFGGVKYYHGWNQIGENYARRVYRLYDQTVEFHNYVFNGM